MIARSIFLSAAITIFILAAPGSALAQFPGSYQGRSDNPNGPTVSPYLNLLQNNNQFSPVTNYQSLVRPLVDNRAAIQQQGNSINQLQQQTSLQRSGGAGQATGHASYFMNYSHFYAPRRSR